MTARTPAIAVTALSLGFAISSPASAAGHSCPIVTDHGSGLAPLATVLNVHGTSCAAARRVVHRRGSSVHGGVQYRLHGKFHLGSFLCRVFFVREEDHRARCASGDSAFVVDYGT